MNRINQTDDNALLEFLLVTTKDFCKVSAKNYNEGMFQAVKKMYQVKSSEYCEALAQDLIEYQGQAFPSYAAFVANELFGSIQGVEKIQEIRKSTEVIDEYFRTLYYSVDIVIRKSIK